MRVIAFPLMAWQGFWNDLPCNARSLLRELDHGPAALPRGSEVVLFNQHGPPQEMAQRADIANMDNVRITHVRGNPSNRRDLAQKINIPTCASLPPQAPSADALSI